MSKLFHIISYYLHYGNKHLLYSLNILYVLFSNVNTILVSGVISDDELHTGHHNNPMQHEDVPDGARTPPTPPARSPPPPSPPQSRIPAVAHLRPVSIPDIVRDMAGKDTWRKLADFDRHYMTDGVPEPEASVKIMQIP